MDILKNAKNIIYGDYDAKKVYLCDEQVWPKETGVTKVYIEYDSPNIYSSKINPSVYSPITDTRLKQKYKSCYAVTFDGVPTKGSKVGTLTLWTGEIQDNNKVVKFDGANIPMEISFMHPVFSDSPKLEEIKFTNLSATNANWAFNMDKFFYNTPKLKVLELPKNVTTVCPMSAAYPFFNCGLEKIDLSNFITSACTSLEGFCCKTEIMPELLNFDVIQTNNCKNFNYMFDSNSEMVKKYKTTIENFITTSATTMVHMFSSCQGFDLDLSGWDVSHVTDFSGIFYKGSVNLNIDTWDTSNATRMDYMFYGCTLHYDQIDFTKFKTNNVTSMASMFGGIHDYSHRYQRFDLDLSGWDVSQVVNMDGMFYSTYLNVLNLTGWHLTNIDSDVHYDNLDVFLDADITTIILKDSDEKTIDFLQKRAMMMNSFPTFITE